MSVRREICLIVTSLAMAFILGASPRTAAADPQANAGIVAGIGGRGTPGDLWDRTVFYGGLRGDVMLGRSKPRDFGIGPFAAITTAAFDDLRLGSGLTAHLPVTEALPIVLSTGALARYGARGWDPGVMGRIFFGSRSYNYGSHYVLSTGLVLGADQVWGERAETTFVVLAQLDGFLLAAPFMLLTGALRGDH